MEIRAQNWGLDRMIETIRLQSPFVSPTRFETSLLGNRGPCWRWVWALAWVDEQDVEVGSQGKV